MIISAIIIIITAIIVIATRERPIDPRRRKTLRKNQQMEVAVGVEIENVDTVRTQVYSSRIF
jgi:hypothetical protein